MDLRKLEAFTKVYETGSFSRAGEELFLSQPTISAHVADLEAELGAMLFDRLGRAVMPTPVGRALYGPVREAFAKLDEARAQIDALRDRVAGTLQVGASTIPARYILPEAIGSFLARHREVSVQLAVGDSTNVLGRVASGELDFGVVGQEPGQGGLDSEPLMGDELVVVAAPVLAGRLGGGQVDSGDWPWVLREKGSGTLLRFEQALAGAGLGLRSLRKVVEAESSEAALLCVRSGAGVGVTSKLAADPMIGRGELVVLDAGLEPMTRSFYLVYHPGRAVFPAARAFMDHLRQASPAS